MPSPFSRRSFLKASAGLVAVGLAGRWAKGLWQPRARAATGQVVLTEDLRLGARELAGGTLGGTKMNRAGRLSLSTGTAGEYLSPEVRSSFPASHVGVHWRGAAPGAASFSLRSSRDGVHWSRWTQVVEEAGHGRDGQEESFGALIRVGKADRFQFRARLEDAKGSAALESVTVTALNSEDGPIASRLDAPASPQPSTKPLRFSREAWGANDALRFDNSGERWPRGYVPAKKIVVHHTATGNDYSTTAEAQADVRAIYTYHASTRGWGDIGYCWLVDKFGNSYEGRRGRDGPGYDGPGGRELVGMGVVAGHARSYNHGSSGVAVLGDFRSVTPPDAMLSKLKNVVTFECGRHGINPGGSRDFLTAGDVWHRGLANVCGHRDTASTSCPGTKMYALLPGLRGEVADRLAVPAAPTVSIEKAPPEATRADPNVSYTWQGSAPVAYSYYLEGWSLDHDFLVVYHNGFDSDRLPVWGPWTTDREAAFTLIREGHYTLHVRAKDDEGRISVYEDNKTLLLDFPSTPPKRSGFLPGVSKD